MWWALLIAATAGWGEKGDTANSEKNSQNKYEIHLPSRTITPRAEIAPDLSKRLEGIIAESDMGRTHLIVQLYRPPESEDRIRLAHQGVTLLSSIDRYTWYASVSAMGAAKIGRLKVIRWADFIAPEDKLAERVRPGSEPFAYQLRAGGRIAYTVMFHKDVTADQVMALGEHLDMALENFDAGTFSVVRGVTVSLPPDGIMALANADIVAWIEPVHPPFQKNNRLSAQPLSNVDDVQAAPFNLDGTGVTVGSWEIGATVYADHPDLTPRVTVESGQTRDNSDHAAATAGTLGGSGVYVANGEGMAPNVAIASYDTDDHLNELQRAAASPGGIGQPTPIRISSHSYAYQIGWYTECGQTLFEDNRELFGQYGSSSHDVDNIVYQNDVIAVFAAANNRQEEWDGVTPLLGGGSPPSRDCTQAGLDVDAYCIGPLGTSKNAITVGAMDGATQVAEFSSVGPTLDGRIKPDLMAQGVEMLTLACDCFYDGDCDGVDDIPTVSAYPSQRGSGTSLSTPVVAGVAALVLQDANNLGIALGPAQMKALLVQTAQDVQGVENAAEGPDFFSGWGIVDARAAVTLLRQGGITEGTLYGTGTGPEEAWSYPISIPAGQAEMHVTLAWDDPPGDPYGQVLINDLDLRLIAPDGTEATPWILDPDHPEAAAMRDGGNDAINNVEQVSVLDPMAGVWQVRVTAEEGNLPVSPQTFAVAGPVGLTIIEPTEARPAWAGTVSDGNRVFVRLVAPGDLDMSLDNLTISVAGEVLTRDQIALHSVIGPETWLVIMPGPCGSRPLGCYDLTVTLNDMPAVTDTAPSSLCYENIEDRIMDRVVAMDRTSSMLYNSTTGEFSSEKMGAARNAGQFFVYLSHDQDGIGVVSFQRTDEDGDDSIDDDELSEVEVPYTLANAGGVDQRPGVRATIFDIAPGRPPGTVETSLGAGLVEAKAMLDAHGRADSEKVIVLVTDGKENFPPYWMEAGPGSPLKPDFVPGDTGIRIDAVPIGLDSEYDVIFDMTDSTGGVFFNELEGTGSFGLLSRLASTFKFIDEDNRGEQRFYYREGFPETSVGGEFGEVKEALFAVESNLDWMTAAFHWNVDDAATDTRLFAPDGTEVDTNRRGKKHVVYHVAEPQAGIWRYQVTVVRPMAEFFAVASGPTLLTARLHIGNTMPSDHETWLTPLRVWIADQSAVLNAEVRATIRRPDKVKLDFILRDDGLSHDGAAGDGIYGVLVDNTHPGPYFVDAQASGLANTGEPFERFMAGTFIVPGDTGGPGQVGEDIPGGQDCPLCDICGGPFWCCWLWLAFILALIATLLWLARYLCNRDTGLLPLALALAIAMVLGWWLFAECSILWCWFLLSIAIAIIIAALIACFTNFVPCIGWRRKE